MPLADLDVILRFDGSGGSADVDGPEVAELGSNGQGVGGCGPLLETRSTLVDTRVDGRHEALQ